MEDAPEGKEERKGAAVTDVSEGIRQWVSANAKSSSYQYLMYVCFTCT